MEEENAYRWELGGERAWDSVREDDEGKIMVSSLHDQALKRARLNRGSASIRRGLIRYMVVAIDSSSSAAEKDFKPSRLDVVKNAIENFIYEYYDQNPISQMSLIWTRDRVSEKLTNLSGNCKAHIRPLKELIRKSGTASLQNTIIRALSILKHVPDYGNKECLIVYSSLSTCDPDDIHVTIRQAKKQKMRISVICVAAEVYICRKMAEETGGAFHVATSAKHLQDLIMMQTVPPPEKIDGTVTNTTPSMTDLVYMGFPKRTFDGCLTQAFEGKNSVLSCDNFICPRCYTRTTDIPTQCQVCTLQLNSSSHIARSHHHLFPVANFIEISASSSSTTTVKKEIKDNTKNCMACLKPFYSDGISSTAGTIVTKMKCPFCLFVFCMDCDIFIHDELHNCPGCGFSKQKDYN